MPQAERFDILVLGSGKGGKLLAWSLARSGMSPFMGRLLLMRWPVHEGMTRAPRIKSAQGVNRRPIWRCRYPDRCIPRSGRTRRWRPYASIGSDS